MKAISTLRLVLLAGLFFTGWTALLAQPLNGNYTINSAEPTGGTNFQSFNDFATAINANGVAGHVTATVAEGSGPYEEQVIFNNIPGTGPDATVTLEGNAETITALTNTTNRYVVRLTNCQYFHINNLRVERDSAATSGFYGIHIFQTGYNITISNCQVDMAGSNSTLVGGYIASGSETSILEGGNFHDITITQNYTLSGGYGASVFGLASPLATNIVISHNQFINANDNAVYIRETDGVQIHDNFFDKNNLNVTTWNAIQLAQAANINGRIWNNYIQIGQTNASSSANYRGIYLFNGIGHRVWNNVIANINLVSGNVIGIEVRTGGTAPEIYFNTISIDNPANTVGNLFGIAESLTNTNSILRNNAISISQPSLGIKAALVLATNSVPAVALNSDYNILYVPDGNVAAKGSSISGYTFYPTLANWQSVSGQDDNSWDLDPEFFSLGLPLPTNLALDNKGTPISGITTDYAGVNRALLPDIGAYEFGDCPPPSPPAEIFGETQLCLNTSGAVYSVDPISGVLSYVWTVPAGSSITSGQGTNSITVDFGTVSGNITAAVEDTCGVGPPVLLPVSLITAPAAPGGITGPNAVCPGESGITYSIAPVAGASSYNWSVPSGASITSGQGTTVIIIDIGTATEGTISVIAENDCGSSDPADYTLLVYPPTTVTLDIPQDTVCIEDGAIVLTGGIPVDGIYSGPGVEGGNFDPEIAGVGVHTIVLTYEDEFGCTYSDSDEIVVEVCSGVEDRGLSPVWSVFPNPGTGVFHITGTNGDAVTVDVFNHLGQFIFRKNMEQDPKIDLTYYPNSVYLLRLSDGKRTLAKRVVLER